jgi:hypothetical protein
VQQHRTQPSPEVCVAGLQRSFDLRRADPKAAQPSEQERVEPEDGSREGASPVSWRQLVSLRGEAARRSFRREDFDMPVIGFALEAEAHEVPLLGLCDGALHEVDVELPALADEPRVARHHTLPCTHAANVDVAIVRVANEPMATACELAVELTEHEIAPQRREGRALRHPFARC